MASLPRLIKKLFLDLAGETVWFVLIVSAGLIIGLVAQAFASEEKSAFRAREGFFDSNSDGSEHILRDPNDEGLVVERVLLTSLNPRSIDQTFFCVQTVSIMKKKLISPELLEKYSQKRYRRCFYTRPHWARPRYLKKNAILSQISYDKGPVRKLQVASFGDKSELYQFRPLNLASPK